MVDFNILKQVLSVQQVLEPGTEAYSKAGKDHIFVQCPVFQYTLSPTRPLLDFYL